MQKSQILWQERIFKALTLFFGEQIPTDLEAATDAILWFYRCGVPLKGKGENTQARRVKKAYCFQQDAGPIYAAFYNVYGIDLRTVRLHWWQFRALFNDLPADCEMRKIMGYRTADLSKLPKGQKKHYEQMRKLYELENAAGVGDVLTLSERDQRMKDYVARRFEEADSH